MINATINGTNYTRVYVCELEPGDTNSLGEVVSHIARITDTHTLVHFTSGAFSSYRNGDSTMLIRM